MPVHFADLVRIYQKSEFKPHSDEALFCPESQEEFELIQALSSDENYVSSGISIISDAQQIGQPLRLAIGSPNFGVGRLFENLERFINGDMAQLFNQKLSQSPYYITSENWSSLDNDQPSFLRNYSCTKNLIYQLVDIASYSDKVNKKLIFFSKNTFALSVDASRFLEQFITKVNMLSTDDIQAIQSMQEWLNDRETGNHLDEKRSILAFVFSDLFPQGGTIVDVLENINHINESVKSQYALYLENFSYEKFVKKLEENSAKFVTKVNDTISKVLSQILGLPVATAVPVALKSADNWLVYIALLIYCIICFIALSNQKTMLDHLYQEVKDFDTSGKTPPSRKLSEQWQNDRNYILILIGKQNKLYWVLMLTVILSIGYSSYKLGYLLGLSN